jgi:virginiamycin B lyase
VGLLAAALSLAPPALAGPGEITEFPLPHPSQSFRITAGPDGALWFTELPQVGTSKIGRITTDGQITEFQFPSEGPRPEGIAAGPDGALWFTLFDGKIGRMDSEGVITATYSIPSKASKPTAIVTGPDGALWFTESGTGKIGRVTTTGQITEYPLPSEGAEPIRIAPGPDGNLWFTAYLPGV